MDVTRYVVFVAMVISARVLVRQGIEKAFLTVWIPFFLFMPFVFWVKIPGLPDPNFMQAAILPILFVLLRDQLSRMRFGRMEFLLLLYVLVRVGADYLSRGYSDAQNYAFYVLSSLIGPYLVGPYADGSYEVTVPQSAFRALLAPAYADEFAGEPKTESAAT